MPGNSSRRGAVRKEGSKKGAVVGSGGQRRARLAGRGPTPKAEQRTGHPAARKAAAATRASSSGGRQATGAAQSRRPGRDTEIVAGRNPVVEALRAHVPATTLYVAARVEADERVREALRTAGDRGLGLLEVSRADLDRLAGGGNHQGLALQVPVYDYAHPADLLEAVAGSSVGGVFLAVALDGVTDPRNLGSVVRSVAAFGGHGVVVPERRAAGMTAAAWKASAGAAARVRVARARNLTRALEDYQAAGCFVVGLDAAADVALPDLQVAAEPLVLVVGSEGRGLSRLVRATCDVVAAIPTAGGMESLNAGVAAGIALHEITRLRSRDGAGPRR